MALQHPLRVCTVMDLNHPELCTRGSALYGICFHDLWFWLEIKLLLRSHLLCSPTFQGLFRLGQGSAYRNALVSNPKYHLLLCLNEKF